MTVSLHRRPGVSGDPEHGGVFAQGVDEQHRHPLVAGVLSGTFEQPAAIAATTGFVQNGDAKLSARIVILPLGKGQMRHSDQFQAPVVNAVHIVAFEIQTVHIPRHLLVVCHVAKTQVAVIGV